MCLCLTPSDGESLAIFIFWVLQFWIEGILTAGFRILRLWIDLVDVLRRSPDPKWYDTHVWSLLRKNPLQIFILQFPCWNWKKISMTWSIRLGYQACPSPIPKRYAHVWTHTKGESLAIFFAFCNLELRGFWQEDSRFARGCGWSGWCSKRGDVYNLCLTPSPMFTYCI